MSRRLEKILGLVGAALVLLLLGGFSLTVNEMDTATFREAILPVMGESLPDISTEEGLLLTKTLGAWFGYTAFIVVGLTALATFFVSKGKYIKLAALFYGLAGVVTLLGSQLIAYPLAFIFFVVTALCFIRKQPQKE